MIIDKNTDYIEISKNRVNAFQNNNLNIRPLGKPIFNPSGKEKSSQIPEEWKNS